MKPPQIQRVQLFLFLLDRVLSKTPGGWADYDALGEFRRLNSAILVLADDAECRNQAALLVQYGTDLFSDRDHERWGDPSLRGVDALRLKIRECIAGIRTRLAALEYAKAKSVEAGSALPNRRLAAVA